LRTNGVRPAADADGYRELFRDVVLFGKSRSRVPEQTLDEGIHETEDGGLVSVGPICLGGRFGGEASVGVTELAQGGECDRIGSRGIPLDHHHGESSSP